MDKYILRQSGTGMFLADEFDKLSNSFIRSVDVMVDSFPSVRFGDVLRGMRAAGDPIKPMSGEPLYDEDDDTRVDPGSEFGRDRLELMDSARRLAASEYKDKRKQSKPADPVPADPVPSPPPVVE